MTFSAVGGRRQTFSALSQRPPRMSLISVDGYFGALTIRSLPSMPIPGISISDTSSPLGVPSAPGGRVAYDIVSHPPHATQPTTTLLPRALPTANGPRPGTFSGVQHCRSHVLFCLGRARGESAAPDTRPG